MKSTKTTEPQAVRSPDGAACRGYLVIKHQNERDSAPLEETSGSDGSNGASPVLVMLAVSATLAEAQNVTDCRGSRASIDGPKSRGARVGRRPDATCEAAWTAPI